MIANTLEEQIGPELTETPGSNWPEIQDGAALVASTPKIPGEVIQGVLHEGCKGVLGGTSKTRKTWSLMDLAVSVATGTDWWGFPTTRGRVLYINFEIQAPFFQQRLKAIVDKKGVELQKGYLDHLCLRGECMDVGAFSKALLSNVKQGHYTLIIIDPIYKMLGQKDENNTGDIIHLVNHLEKIAVKLGAAVMIAAHFSKGNQAEKQSIDRISGSGVWARDPDAILTMTKHETEDVFVVEPTLRNVAPQNEFCIRWEFPLMVRDNAYDPKEIKGKKSKAAKVEPSEAEFLDIFPKRWDPDKPREGLLNATEIQRVLAVNGFNKNSSADMRDSLVKQKKLEMVTGLPRGEVLAGIPKAVAEYQSWLKKNSRSRISNIKQAAYQLAE